MDDTVASPANLGIIVGIAASTITSILTFATLVFNARQARLREERARQWDIEDRAHAVQLASDERTQQTAGLHKAISAVAGKADAAYKEANSVNEKIRHLNEAIVAPPSSLVKARVLVVDDDPSSNKLAAILLGNSGLDTELVRSDADARLSLTAGIPDLVLCDIMLSTLKQTPETTDLSGIRLARWIHRTWPALPIVMYSGMQLNADDIEDCGAVGAIWKPIDPSTFAATVRSYLPAKVPA